MGEILRTNSANEDFKRLVARLDDYLTIIDGDEHSYYDRFNQIEDLDKVVVIYENGEAVACGAIRELDPGTMEVKRMFTKTGYRGRGYAKRVLWELEKWASESGATRCVLETGKTMTDAVTFYKTNRYNIIANYGPYVGIDNSICFEKQI